MPFGISGVAEDNFLFDVKHASVEFPAVKEMEAGGTLIACFIGKFPDALEKFFVGIGFAGGEEEREDVEGEKEKRG